MMDDDDDDNDVAWLEFPTTSRLLTSIFTLILVHRRIIGEIVALRPGSLKGIVIFLGSSSSSCL